MLDIELLAPLVDLYTTHCCAERVNTLSFPIQAMTQVSRVLLCGAMDIYSDLHFRKKVGVMSVSIVFSILVYWVCT